MARSTGTQETHRRLVESSPSSSSKTKSQREVHRNGVTAIFCWRGRWRVRAACGSRSFFHGAQTTRRQGGHTIDRPIGIARRPVPISRPSHSSRPVRSARPHPPPPPPPLITTPPSNRRGKRRIERGNRIFAFQLTSSSKSSAMAATSDIVMSRTSNAQRDDAHSCNGCGASRATSAQTVGRRSTG